MIVPLELSEPPICAGLGVRGTYGVKENMLGNVLLMLRNDCWDFTIPAWLLT